MQLVLLVSLSLVLPKSSSLAIVQDQVSAFNDLSSARAAEKRRLSPTSSAPQFAVQLPGPQREKTAMEIAERYGLKLITKVKPLNNVYLFEGEQVNSDVPFKREVGQNHNNVTAAAGKEFHNGIQERLQGDPRVGFVLEQVLLPRQPRGYTPPTDPEWSNQWTLLNRGQLGLESIGRDLNVEPVWMQGITGLNVTVAVVDDGILYTNRDLKDNFDISLSVDVVDGDSDVMPEYSHRTGSVDRHGTSCAGVIAMARDNDYCGVGVAYDARLVGIRLLSSQGQTDAMEAIALGHFSQEIDIYSNSWGPTDNGALVDGPGPLTRDVLKAGVEKGRNGLGSIYVWAVGNGQSHDDSCATDGYASSIYTIAVGSVNQWGQRAYYDEACSARMAVTFNYNKSSRTRTHTQVVTTSTASDSGCRDSFMGTSASCPMLAGTIALALQANPTLTWRDVQYLIAFTSSREGLGFSTDWQRNGGGLSVSGEFGFGAINGESLVTRARHWIPVPAQTSCTLHIDVANDDDEAHPGAPLLLPFNISQETASECVRYASYLEHVVATISLDLAGYNSTYAYSDYLHTQNSLDLATSNSQENLTHLVEHNDVRRGDVAITLVSPHRTKSQLLPHRRNDFVNAEGFDSWPFMSVLHWGESPLGEWLLNISYDPLKHQAGYAVLRNFSISFYGTSRVPDSVSKIPSFCHGDCYDSCAGKGKSLCDRCTLLRHSRTLDCIDSCPPGFRIHSGYCIDPSNETYTYHYKPTYWTTTEAKHNNDVMTTMGTVPKFNSCRSCNVAPLAILTILSSLLMYCTM